MTQSLIETAAMQEGWNPTTTAGVLSDFIGDLVTGGRISEADLANYLESRRTIGEEETITVGFCPETRVVISEIDWDTDGDDADLPDSVAFLLSAPLEEDFDYADALSDKYGYCINSLCEGEPETIN